MSFLILLALFPLAAIAALFLTPILQFCFKVVEGQSNTFKDAFRLCFIGAFIQGFIGSFIPYLLGIAQGEGLIWDAGGTLLELAVMTWLIANELGNLRRSFLISLLLSGLTIFIFLGLIALVITVAVLFGGQVTTV